MRAKRTSDRQAHTSAANGYDRPGHRAGGEIGSRDKTHKWTVTPCSRRTEKMQAGNGRFKPCPEHWESFRRPKTREQTFGKIFVLFQVDAVTGGHQDMI